MTIRPASAADVPGVVPLVDRIAHLHEAWDPQRFDYKPNVGQMYANWLKSRANDPRSVFLVAEREGKIVAFLIGTIEDTIPVYRLKETGYIHDLFVDDTYRNEGIGRQLTMLAVEKFRELGVKQVRLETATKNEAARKLFESCGFRVSSIEMLTDFRDGSAT